MKPRIKAYRTQLGALKWRCASEAFGMWGPYERQGCGYTVAEAYHKWMRCP
jgi:hypothetical protein